ncbi:hypothetical protein GCM10020216_055020 [Nonomuraea helvata]
MSSDPVSAMPGTPRCPVVPSTIDVPKDRASMALNPSTRYLRRSTTAAIPAVLQKGTNHWRPPTTEASPRSSSSIMPSQQIIAISLSRRIQYTMLLFSPTAPSLGRKSDMSYRPFGRAGAPETSPSAEAAAGGHRRCWDMSEGDRTWLSSGSCCWVSGWW